MTAPTFTERSVEKAVAGALKGGMSIHSIEVDPRTGRIKIVAGGPGVAEESDEIGDWLARHSDQGAP